MPRLLMGLLLTGAAVWAQSGCSDSTTLDDHAVKLPARAEENSAGDARIAPRSAQAGEGQSQEAQGLLEGVIRIKPDQAILVIDPQRAVPKGTECVVSLGLITHPDQNDFVGPERVARFDHGSLAAFAFSPGHYKIISIVLRHPKYRVKWHAEQWPTPLILLEKTSTRIPIRIESIEEIQP